MTDQTVTSHRIPQKGKFFIIGPDIRGGGKGHGLEIANEDRLTPLGVRTIRPPNGDLNQYPEKPILIRSSYSGRMPRDLEGLGGCWIVSDRLKQIFESVDQEGFVFVACDFRLTDG